MEVPVMNMDGKQVSTVALPADIFGIEPNTGLMHQAYVRQMANARQGTHSTKRRSEVSRTTAKMYRQKGTGRARHGSRTANLFVGGAVAHGPKPRKYTKDMPRKMRRKALLSTLSALYRDNQLVFVDKLDMTQPKTKEMQRTLTALTGSENALVLFTEGMENVRASVNNLPRAFALRVNYLNIRDLLHYPKVVVPLAALEVIQTIWGKGGENNA